MRFLLLIFILSLPACQLFPYKNKQPAQVIERNTSNQKTIDEKINPHNLEKSIIETVPMMKKPVENLYRHASDQYEKNEYNKAIASLERAYEIQPKSPEVSQFISEILLRNGEYKQAHYWATIATKNGPSKGVICEKSWRILALAADQLGYIANQSMALEKQEKCLVKKSKRY